MLKAYPRHATSLVVEADRQIFPNSTTRTPLQTSLKVSRSRGLQLNLGSFYESDCQEQYSSALIAAASSPWQSAYLLAWTSSFVEHVSLVSASHPSGSSVVCTISRDDNKRSVAPRA